MKLDISALPTPIAMVARRLQVAGPNASADTFLMASYLAEAATKAIAVVLHAGLREAAPDHAYRLAYEVVRADGMGVWEVAIRRSIAQPLAGFLPPEFRSLLAWATKRRTKPEDEWCREALDAAAAVLAELALEGAATERRMTATDLITVLVQIRNKTKAHGAVGANFFEAANAHYISAVLGLVSNCPVFSWDWLYLTKTRKGNPAGVRLKGESPHYMPENDALQVKGPDGVLVLPPALSVEGRPARAFSCNELLRTDRELSSFMFPNGGFQPSGDAEFLDYASGRIQREELSKFLVVPAQLPASETHGLPALDVQSNVFGNLPSVPHGYVHRALLEEELRTRLLDRNHPIITVHGRGGVGKTSLALAVAHQLAEPKEPHFEYVIWFSARDVDLRPAGPSAVRPAVISLEDVSDTYGALLDVPGSVEYFAQVLEGKHPVSSRGLLLVFDNFETMADVRSLHQFLDTHTHLPNKVLITSRERAFKADYPIEVRGMEYKEAVELIRAVAKELRIERIVDKATIDAIFDYTEGHAYVMRVVLGEIAKEGRYVPPKQLMSQRLDIVTAVFERSFNKLGDAGRWVFLTVSNWRSAISELALLVVLGQRGLDVEGGVEECVRLALMSRDQMADGQACYSAPQLARVFGQKKLQGDPDRLLIQEDLQVLRRFGVLDAQRVAVFSQDELVRRFVHWCLEEGVRQDADRVAKTEGVLEAVAELWAPAWTDLAAFRERIGRAKEDVAYALRRAVEEAPLNKVAWLERMDFARANGDDATYLSCLVSAVEAAPEDVALVREAAYQLCNYIDKHKREIPASRRGVYLARVRSNMEHLADQLDATGLSRLAWLFLLEQNEAKAREYAFLGSKKDSTNPHCLNILERLERRQ